MKCAHQIPEQFKGNWCNVELAEEVNSFDNKQSEDHDEQQLRERWAKALLDGDMKKAHRAWGRWQGLNGGDPWEDAGWRNLWEAQRHGERLWEDFDVSDAGEKIWLRMFISYWEGPGAVAG